MSETDAIPTFGSRAGAQSDVGITNMSALTAGPGIRSLREVLAILLVAAVVIGGTEILLLAFEVPQYVLPRPSEIAYALVDEFPLIAPHLGHTLVELLGGFAIGASVGLVLAAVITQFPFAEKIVTPYILLLVTTPMLALVPLSHPPVRLRIRAAHHRGCARVGPDGHDQRRHRVPARRPGQDRACPLLWCVDVPDLLEGACAHGAADDLRRPDGRVDLRLLTAVGAEMVGGGFGLGNRLTSYSSMIQMPQFFAVVLILSILGILIYVFFFLLGKKYASWEA